MTATRLAKSEDAVPVRVTLQTPLSDDAALPGHAVDR
jgi:hypothetical protein